MKSLWTPFLKLFFDVVSSQIMTISFFKRAALLVILLPLHFLFNASGPKEAMDAKENPFSPISMDAADSIMVTLTLDEKIAQSFVLKEQTEGDLQPSGYLLSSVLDKHQAQEKALPVPMIYGIDLMQDDRVSKELHIPSAEQLGSVQDSEAIRAYAASLGRFLKQRSIDFVIGPSLNIDANDESPYTIKQSFGKESASVIVAAEHVVAGLRSAGVLGVAGQFPGLGATKRGYEIDPPIVYAKRKELNDQHMVPFKALINDGLQGVMMGNAFVPGLDSGFNSMASTSPIIHAMLSDKLGFNGLIWADLTQGNEAPSLQTIADAYSAGNDLIIVQNALDEKVAAIKELVERGKIDERVVESKCKRVIQSKLWLLRSRSATAKAPRKSVRELEFQARRVFSESLVLLRNEEALPLTSLASERLAVVRLAEEVSSNLDTLCMRYAPVSVFQIRYDHLEEDLAKFEEASQLYDRVMVIAEAEEEDIPRRRFGLSEQGQSAIERIAGGIPAVLVWNGSYKAIRYVEQIEHLQAIIVGHDAAPWSDDLSIQAVFGGRPIRGALKRNVSDSLTKDGVQTTEKIRLAYGMPEELGLTNQQLKRIDSLAKAGIKEMAYPGCQVWFAKDGIVVLDRAYGFHTYQTEQRVQPTDLYDLASITKIAGSVAGLMKLSDEGRFNLDYRLCDYLSEWVDTTEYMQLTMREILAHQAGLTAWIPFYTKTITKGVPRYDVYSLAQSETYPLKVAREFYIRGDYPDIMFRQILNHKLSAEKKYKYSDIGYYFAQRIIEKQSGMAMNDYLDSVYYSPLGLTTMSYRPLERFPKERIAPTEFDKTFRNQLVHGDVHDPGAAMLGGVGGHAGLFSNANDLGILMQMYLNGGTYGGIRYLSDSTISEFVKCQFCENDNRRGAGFDKPLRDGSAGPSCGCSDLETFGHQGFTGTVTWADPAEKVVYVFLSNRVYPDANNKKLLELNIRTDIQKAFYKALEESKELASD